MLLFPLTSLPPRLQKSVRTKWTGSPTCSKCWCAVNQGCHVLRPSSWSCFCERNTGKSLTNVEENTSSLELLAVTCLVWWKQLGAPVGRLCCSQCLKNLKKKCIFIFGCAGSSSLCLGFVLLQQAGTALWLQHTGFSLQWLLLLRNVGCRVWGLSSCGARI